LKISVVITNYNRKDELANVIGTTLAQDFSGFEVIVVDNNSNDGSAQMVAEKFPEVRLLAEKVNLGAVARNKGFEVARGKYIVSLDNDVYFRTQNELAKLCRIFEDLPNVACINFRIFSPPGDEPDLTNWCHPRDVTEYFDRTFETDYISEGACAFRKSALDQVGLYYYPYFMGHEGDDMAVRLIDAGYNIIYTPEVNVYHNHSRLIRPGWRTYYYHTRNSIWFYFKNFRPFFAVRYVVWYLVVHFLFAAKNRGLKAYFEGVKDGFKGLRQIYKIRHPISFRTEMRIKELRKYKPSIYHRVLRHLKYDLFQDSLRIR